MPYSQLTARPGQIDVALLRSIVAPVSRADAGVRAAAAIVDRLDTSWLIPPITDRLDRYRHHLDTTLPEADRALAAVRLAPGLLGAGGARHYLILFGNPAESRMLGGYAGAFGELTAVGGRLTLSRSGRTQDLPATPGADSAQVDALGWPVPLYTPAEHLGNVTTSADFPADGALAANLFRAPLGTRIDGVIYVDPKGLAALLGLVGHIDIDGLDQPLTESNVATFLLRDQYTKFPDRSARFDFLSIVAKDTFHLLTTRDLGSPVKIFEQLAPAVRGSHLLVWFADPATRRLLDEVGVSGRIDLGHSDVFDLRTSNTSQNKSDAFLQRSVSFVAHADANGSVDADVTIRLHNGAPRGLPDYVLGNQWRRGHQAGAPPFGSDSVLVSVSTGLTLDQSSVDGTALTMGSSRMLPGSEPDGVAHRYVTTVTIPAGDTVEIRLHLHGGRLVGGHRYSVTFVHQPLANDDRVQVQLRRGDQAAPSQAFTLTESRTIGLSVR